MKPMIHLKTRNKSPSCRSRTKIDRTPPRPKNPWPSSSPNSPALSKPPSSIPRPEKKPACGGRPRIASLEVTGLSKGAAPRGAVGVELGMTNVRAPRLPKEKPPTARAKASPTEPSASAAARIKIKNLWRNAMASIHKSCGRRILRAIDGYEFYKRKGRGGGALVAPGPPVTLASGARKIEGIDKISSNRRGQ